MHKIDFRNIEKVPDRCGGRAAAEMEDEIAANAEETVKRVYPGGSPNR